MNAIRMPPNWEHYPEHDHAADNEEELYIPLEGSGTLHAEGHRYPMERGVLIRVGAATKRKIVYIFANFVPQFPKKDYARQPLSKASSLQLY
jgi:hypothetical protein